MQFKVFKSMKSSKNILFKKLKIINKDNFCIKISSFNTQISKLT